MSGREGRQSRDLRTRDQPGRMAPIPVTGTAGRRSERFTLASSTAPARPQRFAFSSRPGPIVAATSRIAAQPVEKGTTNGVTTLSPARQDACPGAGLRRPDDRPPVGKWRGRGARGAPARGRAQRRRQPGRGADGGRSGDRARLQRKLGIDPGRGQGQEDGHRAARLQVERDPCHARPKRRRDAAPRPGAPVRRHVRRDLRCERSASARRAQRPQAGHSGTPRAACRYASAGTSSRDESGHLAGGRT